MDWSDLMTALGAVGLLLLGALIEGLRGRWGRRREAHEAMLHALYPIHEALQLAHNLPGVWHGVDADGTYHPDVDEWPKLHRDLEAFRRDWFTRWQHRAAPKVRREAEAVLMQADIAWARHGGPRKNFDFEALKAAVEALREKVIRLSDSVRERA